jgi:hypothetical protein
MILKELIESLEKIRLEYGDDDPELLEEFYIAVDSEDGFSHVYLENVDSLNITEQDGSVLICFQSKKIKTEG